jgi:hypothetical protein
MSQAKILIIGIDLGKNTFHAVGLNATAAIVLRTNRSATQLEQSQRLSQNCSPQSVIFLRVDCIELRQTQLSVIVAPSVRRVRPPR